MVRQREGVRGGGGGAPAPTRYCSTPDKKEGEI
jgi:hypothetical protein